MNSPHIPLLDASDTPRIERRISALLTRYAESMPLTSVETRVRERLAAESAPNASPGARWRAPRLGAPRATGGWARGAVSLGLVAALIAGFFAARQLYQPTGTPRASVGYAVTRCGSSDTVPRAASAPSSPAQPAIYTTTVGGRSLDANLYAFAPESGVIRWCDQFSPAQASSFTCPANISCPPPPLVLAGEPLVANGALYICISGYGGYTYALNAVDGSIRWMRQSDCGIGSMPFADYARPVLAGDTLFSGAFALDSRDGAVRWRLPDGVAPGAAEKGALYAYTQGTASGTVSAWDITSGRQLWKYALPDDLGGVPTVANGVVYVGDIAGDSVSAATPNQPDMFALDAHTGNLLWTAPTGAVIGSPVVVGEVVYVSGFGPALFALDAATGHIRWRYDLAQIRPSHPAVHDGVVSFTADGVYVVDAKTGALRWRQSLGTSQSTAFTEPTLANGVLYLGRTDGSGVSALYALSMSDGTVLWKHDGLSQVSPPVVG